MNPEIFLAAIGGACGGALLTYFFGPRVRKKSTLNPQILRANQDTNCQMEMTTADAQRLTRWAWSLIKPVAGAKLPGIIFYQSGGGMGHCTEILTSLHSVDKTRRLGYIVDWGLITLDRHGHVPTEYFGAVMTQLDGSSPVAKFAPSVDEQALKSLVPSEVRVESTRRRASNATLYGEGIVPADAG